MIPLFPIEAIQYFDNRLSDVRPRQTIRNQELNFREFPQIRLPDVAAQSEIHELARAGGFDQAGGFQLFQMMRDGWRGDGQMLAQFTAAQALTACDLLEYLEAGRVGQGARDRLHL